MNYDGGGDKNNDGDDVDMSYDGELAMVSTTAMIAIPFDDKATVVQSTPPQPSGQRHLEQFLGSW